MGLTIEKATAPAGPGAETHPSLFWTADRIALVGEGDVRAAFLAYGPFDPIAPEHLSLSPSAPVEVPVEAPAAAPVEVVQPAPKPAPVKRATTRKGR